MEQLKTTDEMTAEPRSLRARLFTRKSESYLRAARRALTIVAGVPVLLSLAALQRLVVGPLLKNDTAVSNLMFAMARRVLGLKVEFSAESAPIVKDKPAFFLANHIVAEDIVVLGGKLPGAFVGMAELTKWPVLGSLVKAFKFVPVKRNKKYSAQTRGDIIGHFNDGTSIIAFPEAEATPSQQVHMFHAGLVRSLFNEESVDQNGKPVRLAQDVVVQPVALKIKAVNGEELKDATDPKRGFYAINRGPDAEKKLSPMFKMLTPRNITLELTAFPPMDPKDYESAEKMTNHAARQVARVVNPGQIAFKKARISTKF